MSGLMGSDVLWSWIAEVMEFFSHIVGHLTEIVFCCP